MQTARALEIRQGQFSILDLALPGKAPVSIGVLLLDEATDSITARFRRDLHTVAPAEELDVLEELEGDLARGGRALIDSLEDSLSNLLRVSDREAVVIESSPEETADRLYKRFIRSNVLPFRTHIPVFRSLRAAAGSYGEGREEQAPDDWVEIPPDVRIRDDMFAGVVEGRSMEPLIPANSICLFRRTVAGTRQNRIVLVRRIDETGSAGEVTIKRYRSDKVATEEGFQHTRITMVPENPEYPRWTLEPGEQLDVIGEFVQVLGPADE